MKGGKKSRIPVSKSVPIGLTIKTPTPQTLQQQQTLKSQQSMDEGGREGGGRGGVSMVKKVEREVHRFLIQDIRILIQSSPQLQPTQSSKQSKSIPPLDTASTTPPTGQHHAFPPMTTSSPDSGLGEAEQSNPGCHASHGMPGTTHHHHPFTKRMENLKRLALQAKCAQVFTAHTDKHTPHQQPQSLNKPNQSVIDEPKDNPIDIMRPQTSSRLEPGISLDKPVPQHQTTTAAVKAGSLYLPSWNNNWASPTNSKLSSRGVSFRENSADTISSQENLAEETAIFPFIDTTSDHTNHQQPSQAQLSSSAGASCGDEEFQSIDQGDSATISSIDSTPLSNRNQKPAPLLSSRTSHTTSSSLLQTMNKRLQNHKEARIEGQLFPEPKDSSSLKQNINRGINLTPLESTSLSGDENSMGVLETDSDILDDEVLLSEIVPDVMAKRDVSELNFSKDSIQGKAPDFFREIDADDVSESQKEENRAMIAKSLIDHNSTPILRKKLEMREGKNCYTTKIGSLKRVKERSDTIQLSDACSQTKVITTEDNDTQKGAALDEVEDTSTQTDVKLSQHTATQTKVFYNFTEIGTQTLAAKRTPTGNKSCQAELKKDNSSKTSQTACVLTSESPSQTLLPNPMLNTGTQLTISIQSDCAQTDVKKMVHNFSQVPRIEVFNRKAQTVLKETKETGFQTDRRITTRFNLNKITQTVAKDKRNCDSQIDSTITGRPKYVQTNSTWTKSSHTQTAAKLTTPNTTQTDTLFLTKPRHFGPDTDETTAPTSNADGNDSHETLEEEFVKAVNEPISLNSENPKLIPRAQIINNARESIFPPRTSTPSSTISVDGFNSPRDVPRIEINSPRSSQSSILNSIGLKPILKTSSSNPGSLLPSPRDPIAVKINKNFPQADFDDMSSRLRDKALKAKVARTFAENSPQCSPRESILNKSNISVNSDGSLPRVSKASPRPSSLTRRSPDPEDPFKSTNAHRVATGLKPILSRPRSITVPSNSHSQISPRSENSGSNLSSSRDVQVQSRRTGNRVRIKDFDIQSRKYEPSSSSFSPGTTIGGNVEKVVTTSSSSNNKKKLQKSTSDGSGGSTDSLIEELDNLLVN